MTGPSPIALSRAARALFEHDKEAGRYPDHKQWEDMHPDAHDFYEGQALAVFDAVAPDRDIEALASRLAELLYDRGQYVDEWPEDEAETYRELRGRSFTEGHEAVQKLRFLKAARALLEEGRL